MCKKFFYGQSYCCFISFIIIEQLNILLFLENAQLSYLDTDGLDSVLHTDTSQLRSSGIRLAIRRSTVSFACDLVYSGVRTCENNVITIVIRSGNYRV